MKKQDLEKLVLVLIIGIALVYAYITYLFLPEWSVIQAKTDQLHEREGYYQTLVDYRVNEDQLKQEIKELEARSVELNRQIPTDLQEAQLMVDLYTIAKEHAVYPQALTFEQPQDKGAYQELNMTMSCLGTTADILSMIDDIQYGETRRLAVSGVNLSGAQGLMQASINFTAYAGKGSATEPTAKYDFMNVPMGVDINSMFP